MGDFEIFCFFSPKVFFFFSTRCVCLPTFDNGFYGYAIEWIRNSRPSQPEHEDRDEVERASSDNEAEAEMEASQSERGNASPSLNDHHPDTTARQELLNPDEYKFFISFRPKDSNG